MGYLISQANAGIGFSAYIGTMGGAPISVKLTGASVWVYWAIDFGVLIVATVYLSSRQISKTPKKICPACGGPYVRESVGAVLEKLRDPFLLAIQNDQMELAATAIISYSLGSLRYPRLNVEVEHCDNCRQSATILRITHEVAKNEKRSAQVQQTKIFEQPLSAEQDTRLMLSIPKTLPSRQ